jgi:hypothetical protein
MDRPFNAIRKQRYFIVKYDSTDKPLHLAEFKRVKGPLNKSLER